MAGSSSQRQTLRVIVDNSSLGKHLSLILGPVYAEKFFNQIVPSPKPSAVIFALSKGSL
jgi:hypothetical protein